MTVLNAWIRIRFASAFGRYLVAFVLSSTVFLMGVYIVVEKVHVRPAAVSAKESIGMLTVEISEEEKPTVTSAIQPQAEAALSQQLLPMMEMPILSDEWGEIVLPKEPSIEVSKIPDLPTLQPEIALPKATRERHHLPEITLPPLEPLPHVQAPTTISLPVEDVQPPKGSSVRVEKKTKLVTDLSALMKRYPPEALANHWEGTVILQLTIDEDGELDDVEVHQSSGYRVLDKEAVRMMKRAAFIGGPDVILQRIEFKLNKHANVKD